MDGMEIKELLNYDKSKELFHREAAYISGCDAVPVTRAVELLGEEAADYAVRCSKHDEDNRQTLIVWYLGDVKAKVDFLTWGGFSRAVAHHNAIVQAAKENPGKAVQG